MFELVADALREDYTAPAQQAALVAGPGIAVAMRDEVIRLRHELVFDPKTWTLLAEEETVLERNWWRYPERTVIGRATYLGGQSWTG